LEGSSKETVGERRKGETRKTETRRRKDKMEDGGREGKRSAQKLKFV
jgi:hypothetical protein